MPGRRTIGAARNWLCERARGEIIAHFDDDDFSAPGRLADQVQRLRDSGKDVTGYFSMRFTDGQKWWEYRGSPDYALGTSLVYRRAWWARNRFDPRLQVGEDNAFVARARAQAQIISVEAGELMYATNHAGNTSPRNLKGKSWREILS